MYFEGITSIGVELVCLSHVNSAELHQLENVISMLFLNEFDVHPELKVNN